MNRSLRKRVALYYSISAALMFFVLLLLLYLVVHRSVFAHLDADLDAEALEVLDGIAMPDTGIVFSESAEWREPEHWHLDINPCFLQVVDMHGVTLKASQNLRDLRLQLLRSGNATSHHNTQLMGALIRQQQTLLRDRQGRNRGWLLVAIPRTEAEKLLADFRALLWITFPIAVLLLFFVGRFIAIRSMSPVEELIAAAESITPENLEKRIALPAQRDELHRLTLTINQLLDRLQDAVERERQFTSDASHELRTPLAVLKGTMEVLIRKPRSAEHYEEKLRTLIGEVNRLSTMVDQLLLLARLEEGALQGLKRSVDLDAVLVDVLRRLDPLLQARGISVHRMGTEQCCILADDVMLDTMIGNILSNAIKFSPPAGTIDIVTEKDIDGVRLRIRDHGPGIPARHLPRVFDRFYRSDESRTSAVQGTGLGLTIVRRLADLQKFHVSAESTEGEGTIVTMHFPSPDDSSS